ncbi:TPA: polysaccharide biosynthesis/export family protein [Escherichia coli]|uniref:Capsular polysaccharide export system periplasmic protein KpsD n=2 Tax=Escherichia coli TaxID=562 RepID=A0A7T7GQ92_ECOLX|nr:polysaccharide biosynthesis/export family protein [Escherichia coli]MBE7625817.1 polysaccharide export protein [Escherichia coli]MBL6577739.1 polysaccharide biosynthesis/export family protein [Escherichia coli]MBL6582568.1 polysaccharide biosynthesis/export family protein [Escherichia coli]QQM12387.1 Capsular polysaccharide export system periplasmic protein KpsD [Escherichia coli]HEC5268286.1 polysaccharide biosynthesis/export family protein [Escherichia coli]
MKITKFRQLSAILLLACASCAAIAAPSKEDAQAFGMNTPADTGDGRLQLGGDQAMSGQANTSSTTGTFTQQNRQGMLLPGESDVRKLLPQSESGLPPPYGANLFAGGYETERSDGLTDNYLIAPGDKLNIWIWGAVNFSNVVTVDNQGNIFIPDVGPINVKNVAASKVNNLVTSHISEVFTNNVNVYVNLLTATPVSVFVTGPVIRPGQYAGQSSDSVLYFLKRAGGIDSDRGSYRHIKVLRQNRVIQQIDLYEFMQQGKMPKLALKDQDVILVEPQGPMINVAGKVRNPFRFELKNSSALGSELIDYALPLAKVSHVGVIGDRASGPFSVYMPYKDFERIQLSDGDKVLFNDDMHAQVYDVQVMGSYRGPSYFTVRKETRLHDLLNHIPIDPNMADYGSIYIMRKSVAARQKEMLEDSLNRLERSVFTAPANSDGEASIRTKEAELVMRFVEKARKIQPLGKVVVSDKGVIANILLEQGDQIVIPNKTDLIQVGGEVMMPQAVVYNKSATLEDYVAWAGGFTDRANDQRIAVVHANGLMEFKDGGDVMAGDQILVMPKVDSKMMQSIKDITQVIYQVAVAANVVLN